MLDLKYFTRVFLREHTTGSLSNLAKRSRLAKHCASVRLFFIQVHDPLWHVDFVNTL